MREIVGNTIATPNPQPDWAQTDKTKADYIKNKPTVLTENQVKDLIDEFGGDTQIQADWAQNDTSAKDYIQNKPTLGSLASKDEVVKSDLSDEVQTALDNANSALQSYTETDPTVPDWAKAETKPSYNADEVGAIPIDQMGATSGVATLDANGHVPSTQLPSYVDDVIEGYSKKITKTVNEETVEYIGEFYLDESQTGENLIAPESGKIYLDLTTLTTYRWSGTQYAQISESLALGETATTAYYGDKGKEAHDHSQITSGNPHGVTPKHLGLYPETWIFTVEKEDGTTEEVPKVVYVG